MKKETVLLVILLCCTHLVFGQNTDARFLQNIQLSVLGDKQTDSKIDISNIKGSPYLNSEFINGEVTSTNNTTINNVPLRYNIYSGEMEFEGEEKKTFYLEKSTVKNIKIGDSEFIYKIYLLNNKMSRSYFEILYHGKATLLKRYRMIFESAKPPKPYQDPVPAQFKTASPDFYIAFGDNEAKRIFSSKELVETLPDKKAETVAYIKKNKLKVNNQEDLIKILQFYNSGQ